MFRKKQSKSIEINKLSSLVADNVEINGDLAFSAGLRVDGKICGNLSNKEGSKGLLVLSDQGCIEGDVHVYDAVVNGTIIGNLTVDHFVELQPKSRVTGDISYRQLQMDCGAAVDGKLTRIGDELVERNVVELQPAAAKQS
ncbi:MAG: polymer-forming cytoskeletal protein [Zoogloeaceae bacterium]|nr:polymer-forming cytoskeletal protein [Rhodocyclaceae bacterium]MCP5231587.1 polymer-forming cytoskeletal protein [Zoogloeaceae bacterium]MCP5254800.1 polymer-forming cytoskeletal protein [Zoogloeaceae bacterium]MCP5294432.1 polymer-forming cytoskeletal protein [Zoogloeaceae bacterium]MCW5613528.1 polymer-forming cytoskeletal protein [Rhodocyclaceae bacterium]